MAKNLKLNIKNAQLAEALNLSSPKKPSSKKEHKTPVEEPTVAVSVPEKTPIQESPVVESKPSHEEKKPVESAPKNALEQPDSSLPKAESKERPSSERQNPAKLETENNTPQESSYQDRRDSGSRPPYAGGNSSYTPRPQGSYQDRKEGENRAPYTGGNSSYTPRPQGPYQDRREGGNRPPYAGGNSSYTPRPQGSYQDRREGENRPPYTGGNSSYTPRPQGPYQDRKEGESRPPYAGGNSSYTPRPQGPYQDRREGGNRPPYTGGNSSYTPRPPGSYTPRPPYAGGNSSYTPRPPGSYTPRPPGDNSYTPRTPGSYTPRPPFRQGTGGAPGGFRGGDFKTDRRPLPPIKEPSKEIPQQHQPHKKPTHFGTEKDAKAVKKGSSNRFDSRDRQGLRSGDDETWRKRKAFKTKQMLQDEIIRPKELKVRLPVTIKDLAVEMKLKASQLIAKLFMKGVILTLNDYLDDETTVQLLGQDFECEITIDTTEEERIRVTDKTIKQEVQETDPEKLTLRPPVVTFMGHVDHGKTSLIDTIRKANVAATEAGAITQHIGAFQCHTQVGLITVLDTPGHEAFSSMRERGADVTDIIVLVIAGDEGIKAQTLEAIKQAQEAAVPLVVAINKSDKPGFDPDTIYRQLADQNLLPEVWGGSVITVNCSATTGQGIKELLEMLALQAEILELKANPNTRARGSVIESEMHKGMGSVSTILVQNGTLKIGDSLVFDQLYARVKTMHDEFDKELLEAGPSTPVKITGLSGIPLAGSEFIVVKSEKEAREISEKRVGQKTHLLQQVKKGTAESLLQNKAESNAKKTLNLIIKADVQGSLEALKTSLRKLPSQKVEMNFIVKGVGEISESDIHYAATSKATIIGFHTRIESHAESLIKQLKVNVRLHDIIYHAVDDVKEIMLGLLDKIPQENDMGKATVKTVFKSSQTGNIAGCMISDGTIRRNCHAKLIRDKEVIWKGPIASLKRVKEDVKEVSKGYECGITLQGFSDFKEDDIIQSYEIIYLQQELT